MNARDKLRKNERVREIMKRRILKCCKDPRSFFDKIKGTVAWIDYNHCTSCPTDDCILYIDENYKEFLMMNLGISSVKKLKILIFLEIRIHLLSKFIFIEALRINSERKRKIKILVEKIYRNDSKNGRIVKNKTNGDEIYGGDGVSPMGSPQMGSPPMGSPQMGSPPMGSPPMGSPPMGSPPMGSPKIDPSGSPQMGSPQMGSPQMGSPKMGSPKMDPPQIGNPQ